MKSTWKEQLKEALKKRGENLGDIVDTTLTVEELGREFEVDCCGPNGVPFTAWTINYVYFPVFSDGGQWVESVPRNPSDERIEHIGY